MKILEKWLPAIVGVALIAGVVIVIVQLTGGPVTVKVPELSSLEQRGKLAFDENCATCHGTNAGGSEQGPPLVHKTYNPGHHSDIAFFNAVKNGVSRHHWSFGNMPPLRNVSRRQTKSIVRYVRRLQVANGITYQRHKM